MEIKSKSLAKKRVSFRPPKEGFWTIPNEKGRWYLSTKFAGPMTQSEAGEYRSPDGFHALSTEEIFGIMGDLYFLRNRKGAVDDAKLFFKHAFDNALLTQTSVIYTLNGKDRVFHQHITENKNFVREKKAELVGYDGLIANIPKRSSIALTGKTPEEISELLDFFDLGEGHTFLPDSKSKFKYESSPRIVTLFKNSPSFYLAAIVPPHKDMQFLSAKFLPDKS